VEFLDELPGKPFESRRGLYVPREQSRDLIEHAVILRQHPMRWARYPRPLTKLTAHRMAQAIRDGVIQAYRPDLGFEAASRQERCYVRYNPDRTTGSILTFQEGYAKGRREALAEVAAKIWDFRQSLRDLDGWDKARDYRKAAR
jgi:hypothetical protein